MEENQTLRTPSIRDVNILYLLIVVLFLAGGALLDRLELRNLTYASKMLLMVFTQISLVFVPAALFIHFKKWDVKSTLRLNKISFVNILLSIGIILFTIPVEGFINMIVVLVLKYLGRLHAPPTFPSENLYQLFFTLLVVAVTPALFEEVLSRGVIFKGYERGGKVLAFVMSSLMFAVLHREIQSLIATFILGFVIAYLSYRTNSIFAGMAAHFTNNGFIVLMTYGMLKLQNYIEHNFPQYSQQFKNQPQNVDPFATMTTEQVVILFVIFGIIALSFAAGLVGLIFLLRHTTRNIDRETIISEAPEKERFTYLPLVISFGLVVVISYFSQLGINDYFINVYQYFKHLI